VLVKDDRDPKLHPWPGDRILILRDGTRYLWKVVAVGRADHGYGLPCVFVDLEVRTAIGTVHQEKTFEEMTVDAWRLLAADGEVLP
jgi:hypothetical protein